MASLHQKTEIVAEAIRATPPVAVAGATVAGVPLNEIVLWLTIVYLVLQIGFLAWKWLNAHRRGKE
jgi:hypothetical protein